MKGNNIHSFNSLATRPHIKTWRWENIERDSMRKQGYQVKELEGESNLSDQSLQQARVLVIPEANNPFKENEQKAIINFV